MRIANLIIVVALMQIAEISMAATLCVQNKESGGYASADKQGDCMFQEPVALGKPKTEIITPKEQEEYPALVASVVEVAPITTSLAAQPTWDLRAEDGSIYAAIKRWSAAAGWQVSWEIPVDFPIEILDSSTGTFEASVKRVLTAFRVSDYPPYPCFHENKVVRVVRRIQGNDDECKQ